MAPSGKMTAKLVGFSVLLILVAIGTILMVAVFRAMVIKEPELLFEYKSEPILESKFDSLPNLLGGALKFKTISYEKDKGSYDQFLDLLDYLEKSFPLVYNSPFIDAERVNNHSLLFTVRGNVSSLPPYLLASHTDVVPVDASQWDKDPFLGEVVEDPITGEQVIWGRGAIDDKMGVVGILAAMNILLEDGWRPKRSFYVAFGHDEEVSGFAGAAKISELLVERGLTKLAFLLDEGMPITIGVLPGVHIPVATVGVSEKGYLTVRLEATGEGGHSSIPPNDQATARLARALHQLNTNPQPSMFGKGPESEMLGIVATKASWPHRLLYANSWLFRSVLDYAMSKTRETNAMIRTTTAVTIMGAGFKENVIPASAWAVVNHRVHPGQSLQEVLRNDINAIDDEKVKLTVTQQKEPAPISPYDSTAEGFNCIAAAVKHIHPNVLTVPGLMVGSTDTSHYLSFTTNMYRFTPALLTKDTIPTIHGKNERLLVVDMKRIANFYIHLITIAESEEKRKFSSLRDSGEL